MIHYILQTIAFQLFFLIVFDVFLKRETFFNWNRAYLLVTATLSFIIPFIKINRLQNVVPQEYMINLPEVVIGELSKQNLTPNTIQNVGADINPISIWQAVFYLGIIVSAILFLFKLSKILRLIIKNPKFKEGKLFIVNVINSRDAFSFLNYVFLGEKINIKEKTTILNHEKVHVQQRHTMDLLFFEALRIVFWFNPLVYMYQNRIAALHEFIADSKVSEQLDASQYYQNLLSLVFDTNKVSFVNSFYKQSLIKKRIIMLVKAKSNKNQLYKYILILPFVFGMIAYSSMLAQEKPVKDIKKHSKENYDKLYNEKFLEYMELRQKFEDEIKNVDILSKQQYLEQKEILSLFYEHTEMYFNLNKDSLASNKSNKLLKRQEEMNKETYEDYLIKMNSEEGLKNRMNKKLLNSNWNVTNGSLLFSELDKLPIFPGCEEEEYSSDLKSCFTESITNIVIENFDLSIANKLDLKNKIQLIKIMFDISESGEVENIKARAFEKSLEKEAIRVAKLIPNIIPGKKNRRNVRTTFVLPVKFEID